MNFIARGISEAFHLVARGDREVFAITWLTLKVSGSATLISLLMGIPLGTWLALGRIRGRGALVTLVNTGMGLPPVVVGLFVALLLWRSGPWGSTNLMYTAAAMIAAQTIIAAPIVAGLTIAAMQQLDPRLSLQLLGLGASKAQLLFALWREARLPLLAAVMAGFGGAISEVGASMMVGGNIKGHTRVLTTATVYEVSRGDFSMAIALSVILLALALAVNLALTLIQQRR